jgi:hypothetical protein
MGHKLAEVRQKIYYRHGEKSGFFCRGVGFLPGGVRAELKLAGELHETFAHDIGRFLVYLRRDPL